MNNQDEIEQQIRKEMKQKNIPDKDIEIFIKNSRNANQPDALKKGDPMDTIFANLPNLVNQMLTREKRCKLILELTTPDLFKLSEFMMREGIGKAQIMEDP